MTEEFVVPEGGYGVVYADDPWKYGNYGAKMHGAARAHYAGMTKEQLAAIPVNEWTAKDAVCIKWGTWPKLEDCLYVMKAWGFKYVTGVPWVKTVPNAGTIRTGIGFWVQGASEFILFGRKGNAKAPERSKENPVQKGLLVDDDLVFYAPVKDHSSKPLTIYDWAQSRLKGPYLELFARNKVYGWDCYGSELGYWIDERGITRYDEAHGGA